MGTVLLDHDNIYVKRHAAGQGKLSFTIAINDRTHGIEVTEEEAILIIGALIRGFRI